MIIWNKNIKIDKKTVNNLFTFINQDKFFNEEQNLYTSYFDTGDTISKELIDYYGNIIQMVMRDLSLYSTTQYRWNAWVQMYNGTLDGHDPHHHFHPHTILSWVHFVQTPNRQKCFHFINNYQNKIYPKNQHSGDFIVFPSWALHGVDKVLNKNVNRIVVAGNISLNIFDSVSDHLSYEFTSNNNSLICNINELKK